jgi:hypothetical protein
MRGMRAVILDRQGITGIIVPTGLLLAMAMIFALVALQRLRFDQTKVGWA